MGSINKSHNESDGGIILFQGEFILLYCDSVDCVIGNKASNHGRVYLTTHRLVFIATPFKQTAEVKSFCAPFYAVVKIKVEQPTFGSNYIEATINDESDNTKTFSFTLTFSKGGAIDFARAMNRVVQAVQFPIRQSQPSFQHILQNSQPQLNTFYQAPPNVYAPGFNCSLQMPTGRFSGQPPIGFIYTASAPPPYPGVPKQSEPNENNNTVAKET